MYSVDESIRVHGMDILMIKIPVWDVSLLKFSPGKNRVVIGAKIICRCPFIREAGKSKTKLNG